MANVKLIKPFEKDGKTIEEIHLNLDELTGLTITNVEKEARMRGVTYNNYVHSHEGQAAIAAKAAGLLLEDILNLSAPDFLEVTGLVAHFLYGLGLVTSEQ